MADSFARSPEISVIIPCKGRLHHLQKTLPTVLGQKCRHEFEVIVVDYGCPQCVFDWCVSLNARRLIALRVNDETEEFHRSRSRNCGAAIASGEVLAFVDADMRLQPDWLQQATEPILAGYAGISCVAAHSTGRGWDRGGTCAVSAKLFQHVRGYDESMKGWGAEDGDLYLRCAEQSPQTAFPPGLLFPIWHSHAERVQHHTDKTLWANSDRNTKASWDRTIVNPTGFGRGEFEIARGQADVQLPVEWPTCRHIQPPIRSLPR